MISSESKDRMGSRTYANGVLSVIAVLLTLLLFSDLGRVDGVGEAQAQRSRRAAKHAEQMLPPNAAAQRLQMISLMERMAGRLDGIDKNLNKPFDVRVTEMPDLSGLVRAQDSN